MTLILQRLKFSSFVALLLLITVGLLPWLPFARLDVLASGASKRIRSSTAQSSASRNREVLVRFRATASQSDKDVIASAHRVARRKQLRGESAIEKFDLPDTDSPVEVAKQLALNPAVEFAEPNFAITKDQISSAPNDPRFSEQWAIKNTGQNGAQYGSDIQVSDVWSRTTGGQSVVVAIIDSGIDFTHPDLVNNEWTNSSPSNDDSHGWDYITDTSQIKDEFGHGTAIAGIIAAQGNNALGISGAMWRASLMSLRVLDNTGTGDVADAVEAIDYAVSHGAHVINLSWGTTSESIALKDAIQRAIKRNVAVVCSAGNGGQDLSRQPYYPASYGLKGLISVAGTDNFDRLASWSNWGNKIVTLAAPGTNILATQIGGGYWNVSGTSAAAPLVTGIAGLVKSLDPAIDPTKLSKAMVDGARSVASLSGKVVADGVVSGSGTLAQLKDLPNHPVPLPDYSNSGSRRNDNSNVPAALRPDNDANRAHGKDGKRVTAPPTTAAVPLSNLPDLNQSRKTRTSPSTSAPAAPIHANLICADCDPSGGGGAGGSDPYFGTARSRPINRTGGSGVTPGSRNFNWGLPLVSLPGRAGLDVSISLFYNSLVWTKQGTSIEYNADHGTPAPGFQIGLPRLQAQYYNTDSSVYAYLMITPSGGRVEMRQVGSTSTYESADSTYTQLTFSGSTPVVRSTDGTQYVFGTQSGAEWRCTTIEDRNGNYISASYDSNNGHIQSLTDTLSRVIYFNYDGDGNLSTITQSWSGTTHTWATFVYGQVLMNYSFAGLTAFGVGNYTYQTVLSYVVLSDNSSYYFDYNSYGQVYNIRHNAPDGHELEHTLYNISNPGTQTDCPRPTERHDYAQDWNGGSEAITYYSVTDGAWWQKPETGAWQTGTLVQETYPDGTSYCEYSHSSGWDAGLRQLTEWWSGGARKKWISTTWTQDNTGLSYPQNPRVAETNIYDDGGNRRRTTIDYTSYGLPSAVYEWTGGGSTLYRTTGTTYRFDGAYLDRRIIGLPESVQVTDGAGTVVSKVVYGYDWDSHMEALPGGATATQHDGNYGTGFIYGRGNMVMIQRYNVNYPNDSSQATESKFSYNTNGQVSFQWDPNWHFTYFSYADSFSDNTNHSTFAYPTTITDADGYASSVQYNYDFGAVTRTHAPTSGTGGSITYLDVTRSYDSYGRLEWITNQTNSAYTHFVYETNANYVHTYETIVDLTQANEFHSWQILNGAGQVRASASDHPGSTGGYTGTYVVYDNMGRVSQQSNPTEMNGSWTATGDDSLWRVTQQTYDWKGRPLQTTNTDGTTKVISYGGCGCAGGEVTTVQDEHGRQKRYTKDTLGRLGTVDELNWDGSTYATTTYSYDVRDQITQINQSSQTRTFEYDGFGRLWHRITPEQGTTTYTYNPDDTTNVVTDARGATTTFGYNGRHQVTSLSYGANGGATSTANVGFIYDAAGNRTWMSDGLGYASYGYNNLGQMTSEGRYFSGLGSWYYTNYGYNLAGELNSVTNNWNAQVGYSYDKAGRLTNVSGANYAGISSYASSISYRAFGSIKGMNYGDTRSLSTAYDGRLRPTTWNVSNVLGYNYNYDYFNEHTGRVSYAGSIYDPTLDRSYEYDQVGRLVISHSGAEARAAAWTGQWGTMDGPYSHGYVYDVWGNMTQRYGWGGEVQGGGAGQTSYINYYYTGNRRNDHTYDAAGNVINDVGQNFSYDVTGQQTYAGYGGYALYQYYDGDGLRVVKNDNGTVTYYLRSSVLGGQVVAEINGSGTWQRGFVYSGSSLLAVQQGGVYWMHEDPITKSKRVTDSSGNVVSITETDPFGADTSRSSNQYFQPKRYTNYDRDGNQSDEAMFRRYNRWHARFDQADPYDGSYDIADPQSFNRYAYVQNDPANLIDPSGLEMSICGIDQNWEQCVGSGYFGGFAGNGSDPNRRVSPSGNSGQQTIMRNFLSDVRYWARWRWIQYTDSDGEEHTYGWWEKIIMSSHISTSFEGIRDIFVRGAKQIINNERKFLRCFENNRFSADISNLTQGTRVHGAATFLAEAAEIVPALSVAGDAAAMSAKAARPGLLGTTKVEASGINWVFRRVFSGTLKGVLQQVGGKVITPVMAGAFAFTTGYNISKAAGCRIENPVP